MCPRIRCATHRLPRLGLGRRDAAAQVPLRFRERGARQLHRDRVPRPTGGEAFTNHKTIITPTLAGGYGWGTREQDFDIQSTLGISIPTGNLSTLGSPLTWNTAFHGHVGKLWPELEVNYTYFKAGPNDGRSQTALTAGVVAGRFELSHRMRFIIGGGYQKVVSSFKTFNNTWLLTAPLAF